MSVSGLAALEFALQASQQFLSNLDTQSVAPSISSAELRSRLDRDLPDSGSTAEQVIRELHEDVSPGILGSASGRFFAWVIGGTLPSALAADWLTSVWDQNAAIYATAPSASMVEEIAGRWLKEILGLPAAASFAFTTGCQMSHATCLAAARHGLLNRLGWDVERQGLWGAPQIRVLSSGEYHGSLLRALRFLGIGTDSVVQLPADDNGRLDARALDETLQANSEAPAIVVLQAGDINLGAFDNFVELIPLARRHSKVWIHVDGAFGLWANASPTYDYLTEGIELADSWATDGHKWLNVPYDCGYAFVKDVAAHRGAMSATASYITQGNGNRDELDWNLEWSRRCRGFTTYAALRELGRAGIVDLISRSCRHCERLVDGLSVLPMVEVVRRSVLNQALVRFLDPAGVSHDARTEKVIELVNRSGEAFFSPTTWRGLRCMRVSVCNWRTTEADISRTIAAIASVLSPK